MTGLVFVVPWLVAAAIFAAAWVRWPDRRDSRSVARNTRALRALGQASGRKP